MPALIDYQRELSRRLYEGELPQVAGTNTSTTATTLTDLLGNLNYSSGDVNFYDGVYVQLINETDLVDNGVGRVTRGGWAVTGSLTVDPSFSTTPAANDTYVLSRHPPRILQDAINRILRNSYQPTFFPLSHHLATSDENDMENAPATTFTSNTTNATLANETTTVFNGAQSLSVTATAANGFVHPGAESVFADKEYAISVMSLATSGDTARLILQDLTNAAEIDRATTTQQQWQALSFSFTTPPGCRSIEARFTSVANTDISLWDDYQIWVPGSHIYGVPSWITWPEQIIDVRAFRLGTSGPDNDEDFQAHETASFSIPHHVELVDERAISTPGFAGQVHLRVQTTAQARPYIYAYRPFAELATTQATSTANLDAVVEDAAFIVTHPDRAEQYLSVLRQNRMGGAVVVAPQRVGVR